MHCVYGIIMNQEFLRPLPSPSPLILRQQFAVIAVLRISNNELARIRIHSIGRQFYERIIDRDGAAKRNEKFEETGEGALAGRNTRVSHYDVQRAHARPTHNPIVEGIPCLLEDLASS